jgi:tetratricopeptide (TPR) repeat protein
VRARPHSRAIRRPERPSAIAEAVALHQAGDAEAAEARYDRILATQPEHPDALHLKGVIALQRGDAASAVRWISRAVMLKPDHAVFYANLASALLMVGLFERAREYAQRSLSLEPQGIPAAMTLALALLETGSGEEAVAVFEDVLRREPRNRRAIDGLLECWQRLGEWQRIIDVLDRWDDPAEDALWLRRARALSALGDLEGALRALDACRSRDVFDWQVSMLKLRLDREEPDLALPHGQRLLEIKDEMARRSFAADAISETRSRWPERIPPFRPNDADSPERNVICFSLWGADPKYTLHAVLNASRVPRVYPGWRARFYVDDSVPVEILRALEDYGARVIRVANDPRENLRLFWRFLASDDPGVERFLCRDCDAVVNLREKAAVDEWLASGRRFHLMRDHPEHAELIMAGMWGGVAGLLPDLSEQAVRYYARHRQKWRWVDQDFLRDRVWPLIRDELLVHDDFYRMGGEIRRFPAQSALPPGEHVGGYRPRLDLSASLGGPSASGDPARSRRGA